MITDCGLWLKPKSKKTVETEAIFENVWQMNAQADADPETLRISIDTKAIVNVGKYSRGGCLRGRKAVKALDHACAPRKIWFLVAFWNQLPAGRSYFSASATKPAIS